MAATHRAVLASDIDLVIAMMREFYEIDGYPFDEHRSRTLMAQFIENSNLGRCWLILSDGDVIGYVILTFVFSFEFGGQIGFVDELYVSGRARNKGIGRETVAFIKAEAARLEVKMLYLEVEQHNTLAQKLYLSAGFEIHKRKFMQFKIN